MSSPTPSLLAIRLGERFQRYDSLTSMGDQEIGMFGRYVSASGGLCCEHEVF
jgi:hypothetical protein